MKKINIVIAALAVMMAGVSCNKEQNVPENPVGPEGKTVTINASIPEELTKVALGYTGSALALTWQEGDQIIVSDHSNPGNKQTFTLASGEGTKNAKFTGTAVSASSFDIQLISNMPSAAGMLSQTQAADGNTAHLGYSATLSGVSSYEDVAFTQAWATSKGGTFTQSGALHVSVTLPNGVAAKVNKVTMKADQDIFGAAGGTMVVNITNPGDTGSDNTFDVFATIPTTGVLLPKDLGILFKFGTTDANHVVYTRYYQTPSALTLAPGQLNLISLTGTNSDKYAGKNDDGTEAHPFLIGDKYQLLAVKDEMKDNETIYFKMVDDINMDGVSWTRLNDGSGYKQLVNFNGNGKTITKLEKNFFYVLKGTLYDLTLDLGNETITARGALAEYIQGAGNVVRNVTVCNGKVSNTSDNVGGLIGCINSDSTSATITDCTVSDTDVTGNGVVGGLIGYANAVVTVSGCKYTGGTVTASKRYAGGLIGSLGEYASVISDCQVEDATIVSSSDRVGGFVGQIAADATVKGCSVGTSTQRVTINSTMKAATANAGGFVGVCYGTVTKNGDVRNKAFVTIISSNDDSSKYVNFGGFAGYVETATIEYSDVDAVMSSVLGQQVAGFAAELTNAAPGSKIDHCTSNAIISSGANYSAGFIAIAKAANHSITNNSSSGSISGAATVGGFAGQISKGTWTSNTSSCTVTGSGANIGGFAGQINGDASVSKCASIGESVTAKGNVCGGFAAIAANGANISDCYSTTELKGATRKRGGLIGHVSAGTVSLERCYASGNISANFELGGLIGFVSVTTFTLSKCAAWNASVTASSRASNNWSSAGIIGVSELTCTLTDNYRNPDMALTAYWGTADYGVQLTSAFQQPNVSSTSPLTDWNGNTVTSSTMRPYNGKCESGKTLSELASTTLGWSSSVWDFSTALPTLK